MKNNNKAISEILPRTLETLASSVVQPTTPPPPPASLSETERSEKKQRWLDKWLSMRLHHPKLQALAEDVYSFCQEYAKHPVRGTRLLIYGENGTGKTLAAKAIHRWAYRNAMQIPLVPGENGSTLAESVFFHWPTCVKRMKEGNWGIVDEMLPVTLLVVDDIGAEHYLYVASIVKLYLLLVHRVHALTDTTQNISHE